MEDKKLIAELNRRVDIAAWLVQLFGSFIVSRVFANDVVTLVMMFVLINLVYIVVGILRVPVEIVDEETDDEVVPVKKRKGFIRYYK